MAARGRLGRWLRERLDQPADQLSERVEAAARSASQSADAAKQSSQSAATAVAQASEVIDTANRLVNALARAEAEDIGPQRFLKLAAFCAVCLVGASVIGGFVPRAFTDPSAAAVVNIGAVAVAVSGHNPTEQAATSALVNLSATYGESSGYAEYNLLFPEPLRRVEFAMILADSAVLERATSPETKLESSKGTCRYSGPNAPGVGVLIKTGSCQVIRGRVPEKGRTTGEADCAPAESSPTADGYVRVTVRGTDASSTALDWAHVATVMPSLQGFEPGEVLTEVGDINLDAKFDSVETVGCRRLLLDPDNRVVDLSAEPTDRNVEELAWGTALGSSNVSVVSARRNSQGLANVLLALAGALAGLSVGFMPVAYEARRAYRRRRIAAGHPGSKSN